MMEITFITIHDLSDEARILYSSDSIVDVLGHTPDEVVGQSTWTFFNPTDLVGARKLHGRSIMMDKASVLVYCDIRNRAGDLVRCECCFSIVYNVMVACTSIYKESDFGERRRQDAPYVRRIFSSSPRDPRYHMLQHLSARFQQDASEQCNEPRAALFLNRFTRTLTIMYATSGIEDIIGIPSEEMQGRSFYHCISESCLGDAVDCLETAKGNDSLAYMRFRFRNPRQDDEPISDMEDISVYSSSESMSDVDMMEPQPTILTATESTYQPQTYIHDETPPISHETTPASDFSETIELEAIISCTSDGLVVCLRRARTAVPPAIHDTVLQKQNMHPANTNYFAAPWGSPALYQPYAPIGFTPNAYPGMPMQHGGPPMISVSPPPENSYDQSAFLRAIQDCGIFAWDLVGINGSLADYAHGEPAGRAQPPEGPAAWSPGYSGGISVGGQGTLPTPE